MRSDDSACPEVALDGAHVVVLTDGSDRAASGVDVGRLMGGWYGLDVFVAAVASTKSAAASVAEQLAERAMPAPIWIDPSELVAWARASAAAGGIVVGSAFGEWHAPSTLQGAIPELVRADVAVVVGVGPRVPADWRPSRIDPIVVAVDGTPHADEVVDAVGALITPPRAGVIVVHVARGDGSEPIVARRIAKRINERWGMPVRFANIDGSGPDVAIDLARFARDEHAQLLVTASWHRAETGAPPPASLSVEAMAHAPCPVVVFSDPQGAPLR